MPRPLRKIEADGIYHVLNRANGKMKIFTTKSDYASFENLLVEAKEKYPLKILAYCLMPNHWHLVLSPGQGKNLPNFMRWLTHTHTQRWLAHRDMIGFGHLYQGRYKSFPVERDDYFLRLCKYVESNALRAGLSKRAEEWRWGSAWVREYGNQQQKEILSRWPISIPKDYAEYLNWREKQDSLDELRNSVIRGRPFGSEVWVKRIVKDFNLESTLHKRGRPKKGV